MNNIKLESDRQYILDEVKKIVNGYFDDLKKVNKELIECKELVKKIEKEKTLFARGYAIKIGLLLTQKQFEKKYGLNITKVKEKNK